MSMRVLPLVALLAGCSGLGVNSEILVMESNYITFRHPFTDAAAAAVRAKADSVCKDRKQVAIKTDSACSLTTCTTNYQCVSSEDAKLYGP